MKTSEEKARHAQHHRAWVSRQSAEWHVGYLAYLKEWRATHRDEANKRRMAHYRANKEHHQEVVKRNRLRRRLENPEGERAKRKHNRKAAKARRRRIVTSQVEPQITLSEWRCLVQVWKCRCAYCGRRRKLTQDHFTPLSKGGEHTLSNIVPACMPCNQLKSDGDGEEFMLRMALKA